MKQRHDIPHYWTPKEALAIVDSLQGFVDAIWEVYGDELIELLKDRTPDQPNDLSDIPF